MSAGLLRDLVVAQTRGLKLPGIARTFEGLARQARDAHWPHEDYLHEVLSAEQAYNKELGNPAQAAAKALLETRGSTPRLYRNTLVFLAADKVRLQDLDEALRKFLASLTLRDSPVLMDLGPVVGPNVTFFGERLGCKIILEDLFADLDRHINRFLGAEGE